ncbi:MAG TPA: M50 family metallopeptidase [Jiangellales bacterium]|nr:M50 family metallopeptidase [Jiangellales bacterium]
MEVVRDAWASVLEAQPPPERWVVAATAVVALLAVWPRPAWRRTRHVVTIAHEGAHGVAAALSGRRLAGIRLHSDTSGLTLSRGRPAGPGMVATAAAGYLGPALLGLAAAALLSTGRPVAVLWLLLALLALLLLQIRNLFGLWSVLVVGALLVAVSWVPPVEAQAAVAYTVTWFLLLAAPRPVLELQSARRRGRARDSDADQLARLTRVPGLLWVGVFLASTVGALALGGLLLYRSATG